MAEQPRAFFKLPPAEGTETIVSIGPVIEELQRELRRAQFDALLAEAFERLRPPVDTAPDADDQRPRCG
jgi:hypothetical protein